MIKVDIINRSDFKNPSYATIGSSGVDLCANLNNISDEVLCQMCSGVYSDYKRNDKGNVVIMLESLGRILIPTGIYIQLPNSDFEAQIRPKSGKALKKGLSVLNTPGTIDSDYIGEIGVILINLSTEIVEIEHGEAIAQLVLAKVEDITWNNVSSFKKTERGAGGFGHSDHKQNNF